MAATPIAPTTFGSSNSAGRHVELTLANSVAQVGTQTTQFQIIVFEMHLDVSGLSEIHEWLSNQIMHVEANTAPA
ncbi:hypothetical protein N7519_002800 [Penicillium mononematosum]|uniref:uncharacterized protein n=1 Tax=Penicillium mononematosum TaxID=268346 RepID=UPI002547CD5C|nr:uncharacterized protein N7519_002800 [Penicillium mononematosum]KAJ6187892.1 hypothetical protein N7519_002800 [Penicillium mononematosum]